MKYWEVKLPEISDDPVVFGFTYLMFNIRLGFL
ncbi:hypothetical protein CBM2629_A170102 [Cupriavidus taiwanensis]|nr:hypothetical protein CBM2629_A170102 [Cupriavidus taiwanensis]